MNMRRIIFVMLSLCIVLFPLLVSAEGVYTPIPDLNWLIMIDIPQTITKEQVLHPSEETKISLADYAMETLRHLPCKIPFYVIAFSRDGKFVNSDIMNKIQNWPFKQDFQHQFSGKAESSIIFSFNSSGDPWIVDPSPSLGGFSELDIVKKFAELIAPIITDIYENPSFNLTVNIRKGTPLPTALIYFPDIEEMYLSPLVLPYIPKDTTGIALTEIIIPKVKKTLIAKGISCSELLTSDSNMPPGVLSKFAQNLVGSTMGLSIPWDERCQGQCRGCSCGNPRITGKMNLNGQIGWAGVGFEGGGEVLEIKLNFYNVIGTTSLQSSTNISCEFCPVPPICYSDTVSCIQPSGWGGNTPTYTFGKVYVTYHVHVYGTQDGCLSGKHTCGGPEYFSPPPPSYSFLTVYIPSDNVSWNLPLIDNPTKQIIASNVEGEMESSDYLGSEYGAFLGSLILSRFMNAWGVQCATEDPTCTGTCCGSSIVKLNEKDIYANLIIDGFMIILPFVIMRAISRRGRTK